MNQLLGALRAAGESTRLRILAALKHGELSVSELTRILDQSQPRVSRHLKLLCESGLLERYQEGAWVFHRITDRKGVGEIAHGLVNMIDLEAPELARDQKKLIEIRHDKTRLAASYFSKHAEEWDSISARMVSNSDIERYLVERVKGRQVDTFIDLGTGTGRILEILAPHVRNGVGFDINREMLSVARSNLENQEVTNCTVRRSDIHDINLNDNSADLVTIHQVLHYCENPEVVVAEAARLLKPDGQLLIVDFLPHNLEYLRELHAHHRLGFGHAVINQWCQRAGLQIAHQETLEARAGKQNAETLTVGLWDARKSQLSLDGIANGCRHLV